MTKEEEALRREPGEAPHGSFVTGRMKASIEPLTGLDSNPEQRLKYRTGFSTKLSFVGATW